MKNKKIMCIWLILTIVLTLISPVISKASSEDIVFSLNTDATNIKQGEQIVISLNLNLSNGEKVNSFIGNLKYDPSILKIAKDEYDSELIEANQQNKWADITGHQKEDNIYKLLTTRDYKYADRSGEICSITFDVLKDDESVVVSFVGYDEDNGLIDCSYYDGENEFNNLVNGSEITIASTQEIESEDLYLTSETYKIENGFISKVGEQTKVDEYMSNLNTNGSIKIIKEDGTDLSEDEFVGTGMTLLVTKDDQNIELKIAVDGDLDGNGKATATDLSTLNHVILKVLTIEDEYFLAGDLDRNGVITATDLSTLNQMVIGDL